MLLKEEAYRVFSADQLVVRLWMRTLTGCYPLSMVCGHRGSRVAVLVGGVEVVGVCEVKDRDEEPILTISYLISAVPVLIRSQGKGSLELNRQLIYREQAERVFTGARMRYRRLSFHIILPYGTAMREN